MKESLEVAKNIKENISRILNLALNEMDYTYKDKYVRWGLVERDMHAIVDREMAKIKGEV